MPLDGQVVLVTDGGLELPLVVSPVPVTSHMNGRSGDNCVGILVSSAAGGRGETPRKVRVDEVLSRVRVVVRPRLGIESHAS